jgi:hypothetical protein
MTSADDRRSASLDSWTDTAARRAITSFVEAVETERGPH